MNKDILYWPMGMCDVCLTRIGMNLIMLEQLSNAFSVRSKLLELSLT